MNSIKNYFIRAIGGNTLDKISKWAFFSTLAIWGPGPVIGLIGYEGLIVATAVTQSGIIKYAGTKILSRFY